MDWNSLFEYDDGVLTWRSRPVGHFKSLQAHRAWNTKFAGTIAGTIGTHGYRIVTVNGCKVKAARIIFEMHHSQVLEIVDHVDGNRANDKLENLRKVNPAENAQNAKFRSHNTSGAKGVFRRSNGTFVVRVIRNRVTMLQRTFQKDEFELAELVADEARRLYHGQHYTNRRA